MSEAGLIRTFQQSRPEHRVDMHRGRHDRARNLVNPNRFKAGNARSYKNGLTQIERFTP
jgi:hypothetical protein